MRSHRISEAVRPPLLQAPLLVVDPSCGPATNPGESVVGRGGATITSLPVKREDVAPPTDPPPEPGYERPLALSSTDQRLLITVEEAARRLCLGRDRTYELIRNGELEHVRIGRLIKVSIAGLQKWVDKMVTCD